MSSQRLSGVLAEALAAARRFEANRRIMAFPCKVALTLHPVRHSFRRAASTRSSRLGARSFLGRYCAADEPAVASDLTLGPEQFMLGHGISHPVFSECIECPQQKRTSIFGLRYDRLSERCCP
jgi:hypothetical protein